MSYSRLVLAAAAAVCALAGTVSSASACNRGREACSFKLFNNTSHSVVAFWASPARIRGWEENMIRNSVSSGNEINVNMSDNRPDCIYDFKFRFSDGDEITRNGVNVCRLGRYTLND
jgi:hypothetical protein